MAGTRNFAGGAVGLWIWRVSGRVTALRRYAWTQLENSAVGTVLVRKVHYSTSEIWSSLLRTAFNKNYCLAEPLNQVPSDPEDWKSL